MEGFCPSPGDFVQLPLIRVTGLMEEIAAAETRTTNSIKNVAPNEQMFALRLENVQLKMRLEAMHDKMKMVEEMAELRAHAATLEARLSMQLKHTMQQAHTSHATCCPPATHPHYVAPRPTYFVQPGWAPVSPGPNASSPHPPRLPMMTRLPTSPRASKAKLAVPANTNYTLPRKPSILPPKAKQQKTKPNSKSTTQISVPDGGTIIFGGGLRLRVPMPMSNNKPLPAKIKLPPLPSASKIQRTQQNVADLEHRVARLQAELKQLKSQQKAAKPASAPIKGVPVKNKTKLFRRVSPSDEKKKSPEEQSFSFYLGTLR